MEKNTIVEIAESIGFTFNSLPKQDAQVFIAKAIIEEIGCEKTEAIALIKLLDQLACINYSALRQKLNMEVFGKRAEKGEKAKVDISDLI